MIPRKAARKSVKAKVGMSSPSGHGKTFSSLLLARGLSSAWNKVCLVDSEGSGDKYAGHPDLGEFLVIPLYESKEPDRFAPVAWISALKAATDAGMETVIIDSATHEWQWCLDYHRKLGGQFRDWAKVTPEHEKFIRAILRCPLHVIVCVRRKADYAITNEPGRKASVEKVGLKSEIREGFEYELDLMIGLQSGHLANVEKDRTSLFGGRADFVITQQIGEELKAWAEGAAIDGER
ncbi:MAG TPA: AAA family ATPase [Oligoflexus sp.]|uniref:AAA family ATPase n=1 Tax=Oligoflexus sp. TaxID=1971216 RepID=UPI002D6D7444|nr:AAA family ATPase [Oligoflexus sp.]HYX32609.1 AAA family ATPase [Oligoflexus sp.]